MTAPHLPDDATRSRWRGGVVVGPGLMAFTGRIGDAPAHAHAGVQVLFVARGRIVLRDAEGGEAVAEMAIIPPGVGHEVRADPDTIGFVAYLDPDGLTARAALRRFAGLSTGRAESWVAAAQPRPPANPLDLPAGNVRSTHPAVADALRIATGYEGGPPTLVELAARVGISPSRLSHVFATEVGLPYAAWRRWTRLQLGLGVVGSGGSLTEAAHAVGFADSAHLTRTCRELMGLTPTEVLIAIGWRPDPQVS
ncbi:AraC family transcriptional regulator [Nocardia sp. NPDC058176]|uniref:helix-turn-helix transcriptional regulator n=1 Tax=Nocardia sp. NPDC058176 TaxID=3346368 RepID=UPI0036DAB51E